MCKLTALCVILASLFVLMGPLVVIVGHIIGMDYRVVAALALYWIIVGPIMAFLLTVLCDSNCEKGGDR